MDCMYTVFPGASILQGTFPSQTVAGRVCLLQSASAGGSAFYESDAYKLNMFRLFFPLLNISIIIYLRSRVKRFVSGLCPRKQMSCIGVYKRNVISLQNTICWLTIWYISSFLDIVLQHLMEVQGHSLSRQVVFWIWNVKGFIFNEGLHFVLPSLLEVPNSFEKRGTGFYARKPGSLEPRREEVNNLPSKPNTGEQVKQAIEQTKQATEKTGEQIKQAKEKTGIAPDQKSSLVLSARLLLDKVPARLIKVAEFDNRQSSLAEYDNGQSSLAKFDNSQSRLTEFDNSQSSLAEQQMRTEGVYQEFREEGGSNLSRSNIEVKDKSSPSMLKPKQEGERGKTKIPSSNDEHFPSSNDELSIPSSNDGHFLSIPRTTDDGQDLRKRRPFVVYCRNHGSFARHT